MGTGQMVFDGILLFCSMLSRALFKARSEYPDQKLNYIWSGFALFVYVP